jgi:hypothetical protein
VNDSDGIILLSGGGCVLNRWPAGVFTSLEFCELSSYSLYLLTI